MKWIIFKFFFELKESKGENFTCELGEQSDLIPLRLQIIAEM